MLDEWRINSLVQINKNKSDIQSCLNYLGIKLMGQAMKLCGGLLIKDEEKKLLCWKINLELYQRGRLWKLLIY